MYAPQLKCIAGYPNANATGPGQPNPPPGSIGVIVTEQCKGYTYQPGWQYIIRDEWGNQYVMQATNSSHNSSSEWGLGSSSARVRSPLAKRNERHMVTCASCLMPLGVCVWGGGVRGHGRRRATARAHML